MSLGLVTSGTAGSSSGAQTQRADPSPPSRAQGVCPPTAYQAWLPPAPPTAPRPGPQRPWPGLPLPGGWPHPGLSPVLGLSAPSWAQQRQRGQQRSGPRMRRGGGGSGNSRCRGDLRCCHRQESRRGLGALGARVGQADPVRGKRKLCSVTFTAGHGHWPGRPTWAEAILKITVLSENRKLRTRPVSLQPRVPWGHSCPLRSQERSTGCGWRAAGRRGWGWGCQTESSASVFVCLGSTHPTTSSEGLPPVSSGTRARGARRPGLGVPFPPTPHSLQDTHPQAESHAGISRLPLLPFQSVHPGATLGQRQ